jgi:hypothetical protein
VTEALRASHLIAVEVHLQERPEGAVAAGRRADQHVDRRLRGEERGERGAVADVALRERDPGARLAVGGLIESVTQ